MDFDDPEKTAMDGINAFRRFLRSIGMPSTIEELGASKDDIDYFVKTLGLNGRKTGGFVGLGEEDAKNIYLLACAKD